MTYILTTLAGKKLFFASSKEKMFDLAVTLRFSKVEHIIWEIKNRKIQHYCTHLIWDKQ